VEEDMEAPSEKLSMVALQKKIKEDLKQIVDDNNVRHDIVREAEEVRR
jgi:hypothetical protein